MLKKNGRRILGTCITTDKEINFYGWGNPLKPLKIVAMKGFINDWCIYIESMEEEMDYEAVEKMGEKIHDRESIKLLVECYDDVLSRYRD